MKKMHAILMGTVLVMSGPAMAEGQLQRRSQNDNAPAATAPQEATPSYADYVVNDDDHGAEAEPAAATAEEDTDKSAETPDNR